MIQRSLDDKVRRRYNLAARGKLSLELQFEGLNNVRKRALVVMCVCVVLIAVATITPFAYQSIRASVKTPVRSTSLMDTCQTMRVQLNKSGTPKNTCLRTVAQYRQNQSLFGRNLATIYSREYITGNGNPCQSSDVQLWTSINYQPDHFSDVQRELCFYGVGWANLTNYQYVYTYFCWYDTGGCVAQETWNDQVSSFKTGSWSGYFDWDINTNGAWIRYNANETCANIGYKNMGSNNANWNDKMSTVEILGNYSNGQSVC